MVDYDLIVLGAPNYMGRPSQTMKFVISLAKLDLKAKNVVVFGTYAGWVRAPDRAGEKWKKWIREVAYLNKDFPSLSIRVNGMQGPMAEEELPQCKGFCKRISKSEEAKLIIQFFTD